MPVKLRSDFFIDLARECERDISLPVKLSLVKKIMTWSNEYIHQGKEPFLWEIDWAMFILAPLFSNGSVEGHHSVFGSVKLLRTRDEKIDETIKMLLWKQQRKRKPFLKRLYHCAPSALMDIFRRSDGLSLETLVLRRMSSRESIVVEQI